MTIGTITPGAAANNAKGAQSAPIFMDKIAFVGDASYPTGGSLAVDAEIAAALGRQAPMNIIDVISGDCGDHYLIYKDAGGGTFQVFLRSTGAEVANTTNLSAITFNCTVIYQ